MATTKLAELFELNDETFIDSAYQLILQRAPDPQGRSHYLERLRKNTSKGKILMQMRESAEGKAWALKSPDLDEELKNYYLSQSSFIRRLMALFHKPKTSQLAPITPKNEVDRAYKFIAHDGGFFSNFNFLIGEIYSGKKVYPLFSLEETRRHTPEIKHFAYLDPNCANSWLEFFKPVEYFSGDNTNLDPARLALLPETLGYSCGAEFRIPEESIKLYNRKDFAEWRWSVHHIVADKIHLTDEIRQLVEAMLAKMHGHRIAVHIRHPSHLVEQGNIFLQHYYDVIERILATHPDSSIFVASDNELALAALTQRYGNIIFYHQGFIRESIDSVLGWAYSLMHGKGDDMGFVEGTAFQTHHKLASNGPGKQGIRAGQEAVTDLFTLAACDEFICTVSNFTLACSYLNPQLTLHLISSGR